MLCDVYTCFRSEVDGYATHRGLCTVLHILVCCMEPIGTSGWLLVPFFLPGPVCSPSACAEIMAMKNKERIDR